MKLLNEMRKMLKGPKAGTRSPFLLISYFVAWAVTNSINVSECELVLFSPFFLLYLLDFKITKSKVQCKKERHLKSDYTKMYYL